MNKKILIYILIIFSVKICSSMVIRPDKESASYFAIDPFEALEGKSK